MDCLLLSSVLCTLNLYWNLKIFSHCHLLLILFFGPASARSYRIGVVGNNRLVGWLVGNAVFSETAQRIFLIFCMKLGDYEGRKVAEPDFWKKNLDLEIFMKLAQNQTLLIFFSKTTITIFLVFGLQFEWNLFFRKICNLEILPSKSLKKFPKLRLLTIFSTLHH